jgi:hypothetical protein
VSVNEVASYIIVAAACGVMLFIIVQFTPKPWPTKAERIARLEKKCDALQSQIFDLDERLSKIEPL